MSGPFAAPAATGSAAARHVPRDAMDEMRRTLANAFSLTLTWTTETTRGSRPASICPSNDHAFSGGAQAPSAATRGWAASGSTGKSAADGSRAAHDACEAVANSAP